MTTARKSTLILSTLFILFVEDSASAEVRMTYPLLDSSTNEESAIASFHWGNMIAVDIPTVGNPVLHAPITGTVIQMKDFEVDNTLNKSQLVAAYADNCAPKAGSYGNQIRIQAADGTVVRMAHLQQGSGLVEEGEMVYAGQPVARSGASGYVCTSSDASVGEHLHLEYFDPTKIMYFPKDRMCEPLLYPGDDPGECDVGGVPVMGEEVCFGGIDEDGDGLVDCEDPDCAEAAECQDCDPIVNAVSPLVAKLEEEKVFTVQGECLPSSLAFFIEGCAELETAFAEATIAEFSCIPSFEEGLQSGVVKDQPDGAELFNFEVDFLPADSPCDCDSGACCDGCYLRSSNYICQQNAQAQYSCSGNGCGDDVMVSYRDQHCSGFSSSCDGNLGPQGPQQLHDNCSAEETCSPGESACNSDQMCEMCTDSFAVTQYQCNSFSSANGNGPGGGEIIEICSTTNAQTGFMTVRARKYDGSNFGNRPYQVRVSAVFDDPCGPETNNFVISDSNPSGIGNDELVFTFDSLWLDEQWEKAYCVTASTQPGDPGYDANDLEQESWWYSDKTNLERTCN